MTVAEIVQQEETLQQIDAKELARRRRALRLQDLLGTRARLRTTVERLRTDAHPGQDVARIEQVIALCKQFNIDTRTNAIGLPARESPTDPFLYNVPAGMSLKGVAVRMFEGALIAAKLVAERHARDLTAALADLDATEKALATEFPSYEEAA